MIGQLNIYKYVQVLDEVNQIRDDNTIEYLQRYAKSHADKGDLVLVFVMSEGRVPRKMSGIIVIISYSN